MRFLAVSANTGDPTPYLEAEGQQMAELVASGFVEHVYLKSDRSGAVLIVQASDADDAQRQLSTLPLVRSNLTAFTLTSLTDVPG